MTPELCRAFARYNRMMNDRLYTVASTLTQEERTRDLGAFFKSVHGTLNHLLLADRVWLRRFEGLAPPAGIRALDQELFADFEELRRERAATDAELTVWVEPLSAEQLAAPLRYARGGTICEEPLWWSVSHLFNHQTHHRGQLTTLLMQLGRDPGATDFIAMLRAESTQQRS